MREAATKHVAAAKKAAAKKAAKKKAAKKSPAKKTTRKKRSTAGGGLSELVTARGVASFDTNEVVVLVRATVLLRREVTPPAADAAPSIPVARTTPITPDEQRRRLLFEEIQPVKLSNCVLERFGESNDGGYLMCANLLEDVKAGYSYGISGYDQWGCDISRRLSIPVHQYDCFDPRRPACPNGKTVFHNQCVAGTTKREEKRAYDTMENQLASNGDAGKHVVMKMDVEGAEWESFLNAPENLLARIDQLAIEFHGINEDRFRTAISRLKRHFHVVNLHYNNHTCNTGQPPFPAAIYEVLFVNKRIGVLDPSGRATFPNPLDTPNNPTVPDCQVVTPKR